MKMTINSTGITFKGCDAKGFNEAIKAMAKPHKGPLQPANEVEREIKRLMAIS